MTEEHLGESSFRCPVCRARQVRQTTCRRCQADLSLVVAARERIDWLRDRLRSADLNHAGELRFRDELRWLSGTDEVSLSDE